MNKAFLILGALGAGAAVLMLTSESHAGQTAPPRLPDVPRPGELGPAVDIGPSVQETPGQVTIPTVTVYGDPAALAWNDATLGAARALGPRLSPSSSNRNATAGGAVLAFQQAYNADPTSKHPENVLGSASAPVYYLKPDGYFGPQTSTALMYVTGEMFPG